MARKLDSLTIYDLIPFMADGWLVYQPEYKLGGYHEPMTGRFVPESIHGGYWELGYPEFEPEICGDFWDFHSGSFRFSALNICPPADWRTAKFKIEKGSIVKQECKK